MLVEIMENGVYIRQKALVFRNTPYNLAAIFPSSLIMSSQLCCLSLDKVFHNLIRQICSQLALGLLYFSSGRLKVTSAAALGRKIKYLS